MAKTTVNPNRFRTYPSKSIVSAFLGTILGISPALSLLHIAFGSHHHHYCYLHGRVEKSDREETASEYITGNALDQTDRDDFAVRNSSSFAPRRHDACALVNDGTPRFRLTPENRQSVIVSRDDGKLVSNASKPMVSRCQLYYLAPKNSPPMDRRSNG